MSAQYLSILVENTSSLPFGPNFVNSRLVWPMGMGYLQPCNKIMSVSRI